MKRLTILLSLFAALGLAADERYIARFAGTVPRTFAADVSAAGGSLLWSHPASGLAAVSGLSPARASALQRKSRAAELVLDPGFAIEEAYPRPLAVHAAPRTTSASDPSLATWYPRQWHLRAIGADAAWSAGRLGSPAVTVAVIDTGVDYAHPDLAGRVDLGRSLNLVPEDVAIIDSMFPGRDYVSDLYYHGTHVASTIVSNGGSSAGVTSNVTIIGIKVVSISAGGSFAQVLAGVLWAADQGADVANLSLGETFSRAGQGQLVRSIRQTMNYAYRKGMLVVTSAGNDYSNLDRNGKNYVAFCDAPNVLCVSATGPLTAGGLEGPWLDVDAPAPYTNYGRAIDVAAPGGTWDAPVWGACSTTVIWEPACWTTPMVIGSVGTSMAAPHVSALAALLVETYGRDPMRIKRLIGQTADDLGSPGSDPWYGRGRINVPRALGLE